MSTAGGPVAIGLEGATGMGFSFVMVLYSACGLSHADSLLLLCCILSYDS